MKLSIHPYTLRPVTSGVAAREGALLRLEEGDCARAGFADIHPWPELGDLTLEEQLNRLARGQRTPLTARSLLYAREDGRARSQGRVLLAGLTFPESHASFPGRLSLGGAAEELRASLTRLREEGFRSIKLKVGLDLEAEARALGPLRGDVRRAGLKLRLDFNERSESGEGVARFLKAIGATDEWIDWIEDPYRFDARGWAALRQETGLKIALDRPLLRMMGGLPGAMPSELAPASGGAAIAPVDAPFFKQAFDVLVLKPAVQDPPRVAAVARGLGKGLAVTSYLDHPLGQVTAAWEAARQGASTGGLLTHGVYEPNEFSAALATRGPRFTAPSGMGFGWDSELENLPWERL